MVILLFTPKISSSVSEIDFTIYYKLKMILVITIFKKSIMSDIDSLISGLKLHNLNSRWDTVCKLRQDFKLLSSGLLKDPESLLMECKKFISDVYCYIIEHDLDKDDEVVATVYACIAIYRTSRHEFPVSASRVVDMLYEYGKSMA
jgi:hypothetical protein